MLVLGVRAVAVGAQAIERGKPQRRGEGSLGRSARRDFLERRQTQVLGHPLRRGESGGDTGRALERRGRASSRPGT